MYKKTNKTVAALAACLGMCLMWNAVYAAEPAPKTYQIEPQSVSKALQAFAAQADMQLIFTENDVGGAKSAGVTGTTSVREALQEILKGTGLEFEFTANNVVVVRKSSAAVLATKSSDPPGADAKDASKERKSDSSSEKKPQPVKLDKDRSSTADRPSPQPSDGLQEIVVTAQKREQRLQDVPVPVTAITADTLVDTNQFRLQDYFASAPSLGMTVNYNGAPSVTLRGLSTGNQTNPTVGIVVDDVPFGSSTALGGGFFVPDIDPSELSRVEVLRGPQGALYGANALGGLIKFVTVDPSTDAVSGHIQASVNSVYGGNSPGYSFRGAVSAPLGADAGIRLGAFYRQDPGYIDDILTGQRAVNRADVDGGRASFLWNASDRITVRFSALLQETKVHGSSDVDLEPGLTGLQQSTPRGTGGRDTKLQSYRASLTARFGAVDLIAVSGYGIDRSTESTDLTPVSFLTGLAQDRYGLNGVAVLDSLNTDKFTQEARLSSSSGRWFDWLLGGFYTDERSRYEQAPTALDPLSGSIGGVLDTLSPRSSYREYAAFGDFTLHCTDKFNIQIGGRESRIKQDYSIIISGPATMDIFGLPSPSVPPYVHTHEDASTYLLTPQYKFSPDIMLYARLASGYRPGGPNTNTTLNVLPTFSHDTTENYEIGVKGTVLDHKLSFDGSVYYISWRDIQVQTIDPKTEAAIYVNGGRAKSEGVELSAQARPVTGLAISSWITWNEAILTQAFPPGATSFGEPGDRLPYATHFSGFLSIEQSFPVTTRLSGFAGTDVSYVGDREGVFAYLSPNQRQNFPAYAQTNIRAGLRGNSWQGTFFINNVADKRGVLTGGIDNINPASFDYIQPRTIGVTAGYTF